MAKQMLDWRKLDALQAAAKRVESLPPGPGKEKKKNEYRAGIAELMQDYDMPSRVIAPDAHALGLVDWLDGLVRTTVGEIGRAGVAVSDAVRGHPSSYTVGSALDNIGSAVIPVGEPARDAGYYINEMRMPIPDWKVSDIPGMSKDLHEPGAMDWLKVTPGGPVDFSLKGALAFAGDAGINAKTLDRKLRGAEKVVPSIERPLKVGDLELENPPANLIRHEEERLAKLAELAGAPGMMESLKKVPAATWQMLLDPTKPIAEMLHDWRFRHANEAVRLKGGGEKAVSKMMRGHPELRGVTSEGIRADARKIIAQHENDIDELTMGPMKTMENGVRQRVGGVVERGMVPPIKRGFPGEFDHLTNPEGMVFVDEFGHKTRVPPSAAREGSPSLLAPLYDAEQAARERAMAGGAAAQAARQGVEEEIKIAERARPGADSVESTWSDATAARGTRESALTPRGEQIPLFHSGGEVVTQTGPQFSAGGVEGPFRTRTNYTGDPAVHGHVPELDPLQVDRDVPWTEVRDSRRGWQHEAANRDLYNTRMDNLNPPTPGEAKKLEEAAGLYGRLAENAAKRETDMLDEVRQGLGGRVKRRHQEINKALNGIQFLDRAPKGGPTAKTMKAFNPWGGRAFEVAQDAAHGAAMFGYQSLRNPLVRYGAAPAARALWLENVWDRMEEPSQENPYATLNKLRGQR